MCCNTLNWEIRKRVTLTGQTCPNLRGYAQFCLHLLVMSCNYQERDKPCKTIYSKSSNEKWNITWKRWHPLVLLELPCYWHRLLVSTKFCVQLKTWIEDPLSSGKSSRPFGSNCSNSETHFYSFPCGSTSIRNSAKVVPLLPIDGCIMSIEKKLNEHLINAIWKCIDNVL